MCLKEGTCAKKMMQTVMNDNTVPCRCVNVCEKFSNQCCQEAKYFPAHLTYRSLTAASSANSLVFIMRWRPQWVKHNRHKTSQILLLIHTSWLYTWRNSKCSETWSLEPTWTSPAWGSWAGGKAPPGCSAEEFQSAAVCAAEGSCSRPGKTTAEETKNDMFTAAPAVCAGQTCF